MSRRWTTACFDTLTELVLPRALRARVGGRLLSRARAENDDDPRRNGEYRLLRIAHATLGESGGVFFDVGANLGDWTLEALKAGPRPLRVRAFEPSEATYRELRRRLAAAEVAGSVEASRLALGDEDSEAVLHVYGACAGTNSLHVRHDEPAGVREVGTESVSVVRGDRVCEEAGIERIHFLKVDTEGHEMSVLRGFSAMLRRGAIDAFQVEYGAAWLDARCFLRDLLDLATSCGYCLGKVFPRGVEFLGRYDPRLDNFVYANYLACRPELVRRYE